METGETTAELSNMDHEPSVITPGTSKDNDTHLPVCALPVQFLAPPAFEILPESRWIFFRRRKGSEAFTEEERMIKVGVQGFRVVESDYIGSISGQWKPCYPGTYPVEQELRRLEGINPCGPWYIPVYVTETPRSFRANLIDDEKLMRFVGKYIETDRVRAIESDMHLLRRIVYQIRDAQKPQRMLILVDYQNLYKSIQENDVQASLETVVDLVCQYGAPIRRQETFQDESLVYIFDFFYLGFIDLYTAWQSKGYNFVRVESKVRGINPTDNVIIERARQELRRLKDHIDTFCVISGDRAFHEIISEARILGKKTMVAAFSNAMSRDLYVASNMYCDLDFWLIRNQREIEMTSYSFPTSA